jgi:hypothetical protein
MQGPFHVWTCAECFRRNQVNLLLLQSFLVWTHGAQFRAGAHVVQFLEKSAHLLCRLLMRQMHKLAAVELDSQLCPDPTRAADGRGSSAVFARPRETERLNPIDQRPARNAQQRRGASLIAGASFQRAQHSLAFIAFRIGLGVAMYGPLR